MAEGSSSDPPPGWERLDKYAKDIRRALEDGDTAAMGEELETPVSRLLALDVEGASLQPHVADALRLAQYALRGSEAVHSAEEDLDDVRLRNKDLLKDLARKEEREEDLRRDLDKLRTRTREEGDEKRQMEEDLRASAAARRSGPRLQDQLSAAEKAEGEQRSRVAELEAELEEEEKEQEALTAEYDAAIAQLKAEVRSRGRALEEKDAALRQAEARAQAAAEGSALAAREDVIVELRARMAEYEVGVYGLREAAQETERVKGTLAARDEEVRALMAQRNTREGQLADLAEEVAWLRQKAGVEEGAGTGVDLSQLRLKHQVELEKLRAANMGLEEELSELEEERLRLKKQLRVKALGRGERAALLEVPVEKLAALEEMASALDQDPDFEGARADLAAAAAELQAAEARARAAERSRVSAVTDKQQLEADVATLTAAHTGGSAQAAALRELVAEADGGLRSLTAALREAAAPEAPPKRVAAAAASVSELTGAKRDASISPTRLKKTLAQSEEPAELLLAAVSAQLLEARAMLAQREAEAEEMGRELSGYAASYKRVAEAHQLLYASHVRQVGELGDKLGKAEARAEGAEARVADGAAQIETLSAMAAAIEASDEEEQRAALASMGRRLTAIRVKELQADRQLRAQAAGAEHEAVALRAEGATLREQLAVSQASAHAAAQAAAEAHTALLHFQPSQAAALSRAEAAEGVLSRAQAERAAFAERLQVVEAPVAEMRAELLSAQERAVAAEAALNAAKAASAAGGGSTEAGGSAREVAALELELSVVRAELASSRETERIAASQAAELAARAQLDEKENAALRAATLQLQAASDEGVELGAMQWEVITAKREAGEAQQREAAARGRLHHVQAALHRAHLEIDATAAAGHDAAARLAVAEQEHSRALSEARAQAASNVPLSQLEAATAKATDAARRAAEAMSAAREAAGEREALEGRTPEEAAERVTLAQLAEEKTAHKDKASLAARQAARREASLLSELSEMRAKVSQAALQAGAPASTPTEEAPLAFRSRSRLVHTPLPVEGEAEAATAAGGGAEAAESETVLELQAQLAAKQSDLTFAQSELNSAKAELAEARAELAAESEALARKVALIGELQEGHAAEAREAAESETIRGLHAKVRRHEESEERYRGMLEASREALRKEKAAGAAEVERLHERLYQLQHSGIVELQSELAKADEAPKVRAAAGSALPCEQLEELLVEKDAVIAKLTVDAEGAGREAASLRQRVEELRQRLEEQAKEMERLGSAVEAERRREPTSAMSSQLSQLRSMARRKDSELSRMRGAMAELREEMQLVAKENAERAARADELSTRLEARAADQAAEERLGDRLTVLQERHTKLINETRNLKAREEAARARAEALEPQLLEAEGLAARQAEEAARMRALVREAAGRAERAEQANTTLASQLALRTHALNTIEGADVERAADGGEDVEAAKVRKVEAARDLAVAEANRLRSQLRQAEKQLHQLKAAAARWEAEKRLQRRLEVLRSKLQDKTAQLSEAQAELARTREQLAEALAREEGTRRLATRAQEAAARHGVEKSSAVAEALEEMRSREALSRELAAAQQALHEATAAPSGKAAGQATGGARVGDLTAYQAVLLAASSQSGRAGGGGGGRGRGRGGGAAGGGREEASAVVERMGRVVQRLQAENAALQKKTVSNVEHVRLTKEAKAHKARAAALQIELDAAAAKAAAARSEIERAGKYCRERDEARRALKAEEARSEALGQRLSDEAQARAAAEEALAAAGATGAGDAAVERLQEALREAREELLHKGGQVVELGTQLQEALAAADEATRRAEVLSADGGRMAAELEAAQQRALHAAQPSLEEGRGGEYANRLEAALAQLHTEHEALRAERNALAEELAALTPEFFDEVEDLKYNYAQAQAELERLELSVYVIVS
ncbi:hypothetical protein EMIHUDRAFT_452946 [Emiliania huxleyi CCMP1516]|uniref:Uncharacterized protein n=2 Tax=Emiliania huxleyi TaxID=2903 RepID=A0A0D3ICQ1_EMIH1|nr:hypothetical protein EMIHUDRAFT_452946 [Emiliania huxleyi CCMP1516]EOD09036.1 hypothetical protein EMIHUDRAFT_452946 [Emiliania huxleyi CCMP1516]|eukprot:XP_005761465.1 hypothetical protein EMIHUDRAFT_452946 [Emiliania huxleyi CCMP1516]